MRRPTLRSLFAIGVLVGLVLALVRALAREGRPGATPLGAPPAPLPATTPPPATPVPVALASAESESEPVEAVPEAEPVVEAVAEAEPVVGPVAEAEPVAEPVPEAGSEVPERPVEPGPAAAEPEVVTAGAGEGTSWVPPVEGACPDGYPVKAKVASGIYHQPGGLSYERTRPDRCYADTASAEADGFRAAKR